MPLDFESYVEPEVGVAAVVVAAVAAPSLRKVLRRSAVYGLAGVLIAYDKVAETTQSVVSRIRKGTTAAATTATAAAEATAEAIPPLPVSEPTAS
jgi:hypothetical protein